MVSPGWASSSITGVSHTSNSVRCHDNYYYVLQCQANIGVIDAEAGRIAVTAGQRKISTIYICIRDRRYFLFLAKGNDYRVMENDSKYIYKDRWP